MSALSTPVMRRASGSYGSSWSQNVEASRRHDSSSSLTNETEASRLESRTTILTSSISNEHSFGQFNTEEEHEASSGSGTVMTRNLPSSTPPALSLNAMLLSRTASFNNENGNALQNGVPMQRRSLELTTAVTHRSSTDARATLPPQGYVHVALHGNQQYRDAGRCPSVENLRVAGKVIMPAPTGFPMSDGASTSRSHVSSATEARQFVTDEAFEKMAGEFKGNDGKFLAMTAYGAVPLPDQMIQSVPEKFVTKPVIQEREVFVLKQEHCDRVTEREYTQFQHTFIDVPKTLVVDKIKTIDDVQIIEVPHFKYTPVVEDKVVEIPQGIKYVEVPIEIPCRMPPRVVPVPKPHIVERVIETTKPVVQEKVIEIPNVVAKKVPKIVTKEIPYLVPRYVEKVIEVPYSPGQELPATQGTQVPFVPQPLPLPAMAPEQNGSINSQRNGAPGVAETPGFPPVYADGAPAYNFPPTAREGFFFTSNPNSGPVLHPSYMFQASQQRPTMAPSSTCFPLRNASPNQQEGFTLLGSNVAYCPNTNVVQQHNGLASHCNSEVSVTLSPMPDANGAWRIVDGNAPGRFSAGCGTNLVARRCSTKEPQQVVTHSGGNI